MLVTDVSYTELESVQGQSHVYRRERDDIYYHADETGDLYGPFFSEDAAIEALERYCHWLNTGEMLEA